MLEITIMLMTLKVVIKIQKKKSNNNNIAKSEDKHDNNNEKNNVENNYNIAKNNGKITIIMEK